MRRQSLIVLAAAVFLGLLAVFLVNTYIGAAEGEQRAQAVPVSQVAVAMVPLSFGTPITPEKVKMVNWPSESVPPGAIRSLEDLRRSGRAQVALRPIEVGEPILKSKLSGANGRATVSAVLPPDMRAAAIRLSDVGGVGGLVLPGDRVDVILTRTAGANGTQLAETLLQDVKVIAIDQNADDAGDKPQLGKTATLEVRPYDAQKLALAQSVGALSLALRSTTASRGEMYTDAVSMRDLKGGAFNQPSYQPTQVSYARVIAPRPAPRPAGPVQKAQARPMSQTAPQAPKPVTSTVEIVRGTTSSNYEVDRYARR
jgi:pilus assembly protein CpaB